MQKSCNVALRGHSQLGVSSLRFLPASVDPERGHLLLSGDASGTVRLWDVRTEAMLTELGNVVEERRNRGAPWPVLAVEPNETGDSVYVQSKGGQLRLVDIVSGDSRTVAGVTLSSPREVARIGNSFCGIRVSKEGLVVGPGDGIKQEVVVLDKREAYRVAQHTKPTAHANGGRGLLMCLELTTGNGSFVTGYESGDVCVWDMRSLSKPMTTSATGANPVICLATSPRGGDLIIAGTAGEFIYASYGNKAVRSTKIAQGCSSVQWRNDGKVIAAGCWDGTVRFLDGRRDRTLLFKLSSRLEHKPKVQCVAFSPVSSLVASGSTTGEVLLRNVF